jgi:histidine ammonia-lyase
MGACLDQMRHAADVLLVEANAVSDNPLIFPDTGEVLSGGNFHAEPVAFAPTTSRSPPRNRRARRAPHRAADRRDAVGPAAVPRAGRRRELGFMIAHVTPALASENKTLAHPASVDSLPTSANQEDHVSMATFAARKLADIADNTKHILAIELLAAQGVDLRAASHEPELAPVMETIRSKVAHYGSITTSHRTSR